MNNIFDSHAHYDSEAFNDDRKELLHALPSQGVCGIINCASDMASAITSLELADEFDFIYAACGVHPHEAEGCKQGYIDVLRKLCSEEKCVAVGEIGLDYHYDFSPRDIQIKVFEEQIVLAKELDLPIIVHDREAHADTLKILKENKVYECGGVFHCYSGSAEMVREITDELNMYIAFGGTITFKNATTPKEAAKAVPLDKLLIETDAPYLAPVPYRGKRNSSVYLNEVVNTLSELKGVSTAEIEHITFSNGKKLFNI